MNIIDAYLILENYTESLAYGQRPNEDVKRISCLKNTRKEIHDAYKLVFAHAIFWDALTYETLTQYKQLLKHLGGFIDDNLVNELNRIRATLNNKNPFTKLRDKSARTLLEERKKQLEMIIAHSIFDGMSNDDELNSFLDWLIPAITTFKEKCRSLSKEELNKQYYHLLGCFICDVYEHAHITREVDDVEYFWPFHQLYRLSNDPKFDNLFSKYKVYIANAYYNSQKQSI